MTNKQGNNSSEVFVNLFSLLPVNTRLSATLARNLARVCIKGSFIKNIRFLKVIKCFCVCLNTRLVLYVTEN